MEVTHRAGFDIPHISRSPTSFLSSLRISYSAPRNRNNRFYRYLITILCRFQENYADYPHLQQIFYPAVPYGKHTIRSSPLCGLCEDK